MVKNFIQGRFEGRVKIVSFGPFEFAATCKKGRLQCLLFFDPVGKGNYLILVLINTKPRKIWKFVSTHSLFN